MLQSQDISNLVQKGGRFWLRIVFGFRVNLDMSSNILNTGVIQPGDI
jgi:hypothetical protein